VQGHNGNTSITIANIDNLGNNIGGNVQVEEDLIDEDDETVPPLESIQHIHVDI
jgi:hypothetical protein